MANQYVTTIKNMYTVPNPQGYVVNVIFEVTGNDGQGHTASIDGNCQFTPTEGQTIIPYDQLTQAEVLGWINASTNNLENYYANIDGQIQSMITPPVSPSNTPLPW
jgi:hypothetical protein